MYAPSIYRLWHPKVLGVPALDALFLRAFSHRRSPQPWSAVRPELERMLPADNTGVFVGREADSWRGLVIAFASATRLLPDVSVYYLYNEGSPALRRALIDQVVVFAQERGYDAIKAVDSSGREAAFSRLFGAAVGPAERVGALYRFRIAEGADHG